MTNLKNSVAKNIKTKVAGQTQDDVVYCYIFDAILEQRLPPATKLSEEALQRSSALVAQSFVALYYVFLWNKLSRSDRIVERWLQHRQKMKRSR